MSPEDLKRELAKELARRELERRKGEVTVTPTQRRLSQQRLEAGPALPSLEDSIAAERDEAPFMERFTAGVNNAITQGADFIGESEQDPRLTSIAAESGAGTLGEVGTTFSPSGLLENIIGRGATRAIGPVLGRAVGSGTAAAGEGYVMAADPSDAATQGAGQGAIAGVLQGTMGLLGKGYRAANKLSNDAIALLQEGVNPSAGQMGGPLGEAMKMFETTVNMFPGLHAGRRVTQEGLDVVGTRAIPRELKKIGGRVRLIPGARSKYPTGSQGWFMDMDARLDKSYNRIMSGKNKSINKNDLLADVRDAMDDADDTILGMEDRSNITAMLENRLGGATGGPPTITGSQWRDLRKMLNAKLSALPANSTQRGAYYRMIEAMDEHLKKVPGLSKLELKALEHTNESARTYLDILEAHGNTAAGKEISAADLARAVKERSSLRKYSQGLANNQDVVDPLARVADDLEGVPPITRLMMQTLRSAGAGMSGAVTGGALAGPPGAIVGLALAPILGAISSSKGGARVIRGMTPEQKAIAKWLDDHLLTGTITSSILDAPTD